MTGYGNSRGFDTEGRRERIFYASAAHFLFENLFAKCASYAMIEITI